MDASPRLTHSQEQEVELVKAARNGSEHALNTLMKRYYPRIARFLNGLTNDRELAEDLAQDTFLQACRCIVNLKREIAFEAWLYQIARNSWRSELRNRSQRRIISIDLLDADHTSSFADLTHPDHAETVADRDLIVRAVEELSPTLKEALALHALAGLTTREISVSLNISIHAAEKRVSRAYGVVHSRDVSSKQEIDRVAE